MIKPPVGEIFAYAGSSTPSGFLLCDGSAVSRTTYAELFAKVGTSFGTGDGSTTFNVPNMKGRTLFGYKSSDTIFDTIGETGGAQTANLQHSHTRNAHTHTASGTTNAGDNQAVYASSAQMTYGGHTHTYSATSGVASDSGTDTQLSTTQTIQNPYITMNFIIRFKAYKTNPEIIYELV